MPARFVKILLRLESRIVFSVIVIMAALLFVTTSIVNGIFNQEIREGVERDLRTAENVFRRREKERGEVMKARYEHIANEPRIKAIVALFKKGTAVDPVAARATADDFLKKDLGDELPETTILVSDSSGVVVAGVSGDSRLKVSEIEKSVTPIAKEAMNGESVVGSVRAGQNFIEVVSVPVVTDRQVDGTLNFIHRAGSKAVSDFKDLTATEAVLFFDGEIVASTLRNEHAVEEHLRDEFGPYSGSAHSPLTREVRSLELGTNRMHYKLVVGRNPSAGSGLNLLYVLLASYERPMRNLAQIKSVLIGLTLGGMILSGTIIWLLIRRLTWPLRQLRDGAEAVGRGELTHKVPVSSRDECGALAVAFNHMTENLLYSRAELERTVESLKTTQAQLLQSEKLSAIGEFVAGVTHELNNPLTGVIGFAELIKQGGKDVKVDYYLDNIVSCAQRCHKIVQSLLSFARQQAPERNSVNVNELIENTLNFVQYEFRTSNIIIKKDLGVNLPPIWADAHQLQQVFLNLVTNARHAMENFQHDGLLTVITDVRDGKVRVQFRDNGPGISPSNLAKIFNPFFTTKEVGKGTGLARIFHS